MSRTPITVEQAQKEKAVLERAIFDLLNTFQQRTGAHVADVDVRRAGIPHIGGQLETSFLTGVWVEVQL